MRLSANKTSKTRSFIKSLWCLFILLGANTYGSTLLVLGDSLSAGYGINQENGWVALLEKDLGDDHRIINGSISGDTTGGGLNRLPRLLEEFSPDFVLLELGGNDGLRGQPLALMKANLQAMIRLVREAGAEPVLFGMRLPPNYGRRYSDAFAAVYPQLSEAEDVLLIPFQLEELSVTEGMIQEDGLHPTAMAQPIIKEVIKRYIKPLMLK
ncbi:acyl-CoA thioesterase I [marine gamma proteobacterium HTCC2207]|jgi:acyl-CoA thioesterase-1|uniref:Acyl-CoA thioesterase I n=1 Tax=gamma proteobacterium HTCC2207 TaxID=314287 RepID=Q1YR06_9GAMM|nr:acyl-CoA thioesterase I [marine gamma proteobacterium HTCC2207] [gamma proteobacterium HTCC2207]MBT6116078.1 arylesterase [Porticoccaceae bacterium]MBT6593798.1 arylesterase [Porticoccaceae bacterium]MDC0517186.1 arylesterase [Porticoccaceae bacterium]MDC0588895.1 arylesterase [Porticoccaceae bacterium]